MSGLFVPGNGAIFSADIAVPEHERELRFYSRVLSTGGTPLWREDLMNNLGMPVIGLGAFAEAYRDFPLQWMPHIQVSDVGTSVERATASGGKVLMHSQSREGVSQWAVLMDPNGAAFGVVPVTPAEAVASLRNLPDDEPMGRIVWLDLTVPDAEATRDFYMSVIGWSSDEVEVRDGDTRYADFNMLRHDQSRAAGVCHARGQNADLPPVWMIYLPVGDLAESLRRVEAEGGKVVTTMRGADGEYAYAAVQDPVGVYFGLVPSL